MFSKCSWNLTSAAPFLYSSWGKKNAVLWMLKLSVHSCTDIPFLLVLKFICQYYLMDLTRCLQTCMKAMIFGNPDLTLNIHYLVVWAISARWIACGGCLLVLSWLHENQCNNLKHKYLELVKRNFLSFCFFFLSWRIQWFWFQYKS